MYKCKKKFENFSYGVKTIQTRVLIIGGGVTGAGIARDLSLRGVECLLAEKGDINSGASGGNHGLLHSGARYIDSDPASAVECSKESALLKRLAPGCIDDAGGLFVAVEGDDEQYIADFQTKCLKCGIEADEVDIKGAREMEPALSKRLIAAFSVKDASIDPFKLSLLNIKQATRLGAKMLRRTKVDSFTINGGVIQRAHLVNMDSGEEFTVEPELVINAAGAWAGGLAAKAGVKVNMLYSKGSLLVTQHRLAERVINRLRKPTDGDIIVPGGAVSVIGTTSVRLDSPDAIFPEIDEIDGIIEEAAAMAPGLQNARFIRAYCGVRPLISSDDADDDRSVSRGFALIDHSADEIENFITITGGKLTTYRLMAEKASDLACKRLGVSAPCVTAIENLTSETDEVWTEPNRAAIEWLGNRDPRDFILCECEMVSKGVVEKIIEESLGADESPTMMDIGLRSRVGKGPCQGAFCGLRLAAHLYAVGALSGGRGLEHLRIFIEGRWRGLKPLLWGLPLAQFELQEALHCGLFGLENQPGPEQIEQAGLK